MKNQAKLQDVVDKFNTRFPIGTPGILIRDSGELTPCVIRIEASVTQNGEIMAIFSNVSGLYLANRFKPNSYITKNKWLLDGLNAQSRKGLN